jgi:hypothetical protein
MFVRSVVSVLGAVPSVFILGLALIVITQGLLVGLW